MGRNPGRLRTKIALTAMHIFSHKTLRKALLIAAAISAPHVLPHGDADDAFASYQAEIAGNFSTSDFAPYFIGSMNGGRIFQKDNLLLDAKIQRPLSQATRFSWGFGAEVLAGYSNSTTYQKYDAATESWTGNRQHPPYAWMQQLYAEVKYRSVFLSVGMKERGSCLYNNQLGSGDFIESPNARPVPQVRIGFIDFQNIPFTNGWVQIQGEIAYGKYLDNSFLKNHYNYYNYHITLGPLYNYKRCYFRTKPAMPLSVSVGMQTGGAFGGERYEYSKGKLVAKRKFSSSIASFFKMWLPIGENGEDYYVGSTVGSWDLKARYRLRNDDEIYAYIQWPWEDGSGIGRFNKFDGIWGLEYKAARTGWITGAVVEYVDFRDQSGPINWEPDDTPGTEINTVVSGGDNYYNNFYYNSYAYYGLSMGTPVLPSPIYNLDGYPGFLCNRLNGFHLGVTGCLSPTVDYRLLAGYQRGLGRYQMPYFKPRTDFSMMLEAKWDASALLQGLKAKAQLAFDCGKLRGNNFGMLFSVSYSGLIGKKH